MHFLFVDLDDTIFQSRRKTPAEEGIRSVAYSPDGVDNGFMTRRQQAAFGLLGRSMTVIPVTARDLAAFQRVRFDPPPFAVIDFGGIILESGGSPVEAWLERSRELSDLSADWIRSLQVEILEFISAHALNAICRVVGDFGLSLYLVAKYREGDEEALNRIAGEVLMPWITEHPGLARFCLNGNNLAVMPAWLGKGPAVEFLQRLLAADTPNLVTWGMGDSLSDLGFMSSCDYCIVPNGSQISRQRLRGC